MFCQAYVDTPGLCSHVLNTGKGGGVQYAIPAFLLFVPVLDNVTVFVLILKRYRPREGEVTTKDNRKLQIVSPLILDCVRPHGKKTPKCHKVECCITKEYHKVYAQSSWGLKLSQYELEYTLPEEFKHDGQRLSDLTWCSRRKEQVMHWSAWMPTCFTGWDITRVHARYLQGRHTKRNLEH